MKTFITLIFSMIIIMGFFTLSGCSSEIERCKESGFTTEQCHEQQMAKIQADKDVRIARESNPMNSVADIAGTAGTAYMMGKVLESSNQSYNTRNTTSVIQPFYNKNDKTKSSGVMNKMFSKSPTYTEPRRPKYSFSKK